MQPLCLIKLLQLQSCCGQKDKIAGRSLDLQIRGKILAHDPSSYRMAGEIGWLHFEAL